MSALPSAAAAIGSGFLASLWQLHRSPWALVPAALAAVMLAARWYLNPRSSVTHLVILPPAEHGDPVIDDALPLFFEHRPAAADSTGEAIREMEREWNEQGKDDQ